MLFAVISDVVIHNYVNEAKSLLLPLGDFCKFKLFHHFTDAQRCTLRYYSPRTHIYCPSLLLQPSPSFDGILLLLNTLLYLLFPRSAVVYMSAGRMNVQRCAVLHVCGDVLFVNMRCAPTCSLSPA